MRKLLLALLLLVTTLCLGQSRNERIILNILDMQTKAWNRGDIEGFMQGYWKHDSLMFIGKSGVTYGWTNTLNNYKRGYPDTVAMGKLNFTILSLKQLSSKYYSIAGKWDLQRSIGNLSGHFTLLFRKVRGRWVIVSDHSS